MKYKKNRTKINIFSKRQSGAIQVYFEHLYQK